MDGWMDGRLQLHDSYAGSSTEQSGGGAGGFSGRGT